LDVRLGRRRGAGLRAGRYLAAQGLREGDGGDDHGRDDHVAKPANQARAIAIAIITDSVVDQL
jgi:hypothetical protein